MPPPNYSVLKEQRCATAFAQTWISIEAALAKIGLGKVKFLPGHASNDLIIFYQRPNINTPVHSSCKQPGTFIRLQNHPWPNTHSESLIPLTSRIAPSLSRARVSRINSAVISSMIIPTSPPAHGKCFYSAPMPPVICNPLRLFYPPNPRSL